MSEEQDKGQEEQEVARQLEPLPEQIAEALGDRVSEGGVLDGVVHITVPAEELADALRIVGFEIENSYSHLSDLCGVDRADCIEVVYHLFRPMSDEAVVVRVKLPRGNPQVPTATELWDTANWAEREAAEMYGVTFTGHPDPRPLLLPEDIQGHPMRKDWEYPEEHPYLSREPLHEDFPDVVGRVRVEAPPGREEEIEE